MKSSKRAGGGGFANTNTDLTMPIDYTQSASFLSISLLTRFMTQIVCSAVV